MQANQTLIGSNGLQVALFPMDVMIITQGIGGSFSHQGNYAIDFIGYHVRYPIYAPCDVELVYVSVDSVVYTSLHPVNLADGTVGKLTMLLAHDNDSYTIPRTVMQGQLLAKTGTKGNVTGDHIHLEVKKGTWEGQVQNAHGVWMVKGSEPPYHLLYINDTHIVDDRAYPWKRSTDWGLPIWLY